MDQKGVWREEEKRTYSGEKIAGEGQERLRTIDEKKRDEQFRTRSGAGWEGGRAAVSLGPQKQGSQKNHTKREMLALKKEKKKKKRGKRKKLWPEETCIRRGALLVCEKKDF